MNVGESHNAMIFFLRKEIFDLARKKTKNQKSMIEKKIKLMAVVIDIVIKNE